MKQNIPGFFGVGSSIAELENEEMKDDLKRLYQTSLFFRTLIGNSMMSLTKSYYPATHYLADDKEFGEFWQTLFKEYQLSKEKVFEISGLKELMENNPTIRSSVRLRERIVLPLIGIQQFALMNLRYPKEDEKKWDPIYRKLVVRCMFGIINAARNSA
jgi:phosphoenolpyruvate carboxylase